MSEFISDIEYVPLEFGKDFMIDRIDNVIVTKDRIFVSSENYCYAFTRDGKFVTSIGRIGRGPGEWTSSLDNISVDEDNRKIYLDVYYSVLEYTWDGKFIREIKKPLGGKGDSAPRPMDVAFLRGNLFLGWLSSIARSGPTRWVIFDDKGSTVETFDNRMKGSVKWRYSRSINPLIISERAYVKENINDTLYSIGVRNELTPAFVFDLGKFSPLKSGVASLSGSERYERSYMELPGLEARRLSISLPITMSRSNIFFSFRFHNVDRSGVRVPKGNTTSMKIGGTPMVKEIQEIEIDDTIYLLGIYDIASGRTKLLDRDPLTRRLGLVNDIDGGLSFWPRTVSSDGGLVDICESFDMKDLLDEEYFGAHKIGDPAANERLRKLLEGLEYDDNPVIVIAKLKK